MENIDPKLLKRARYRTTRINNQLKKKYPLFSHQWETTVEEQLVEIKRQDEKNARYFSKLAAFDKVQREKARWYRAQLARYNSPQTLFAVAEYRYRMLPPTPEYSADFYHTLLRAREEVVGDNRS